MFKGNGFWILSLEKNLSFAAVMVIWEEAIPAAVERMKIMVGSTFPMRILSSHLARRASAILWQKLVIVLVKENHTTGFLSRAVGRRLSLDLNFVKCLGSEGCS